MVVALLASRTVIATGVQFTTSPLNLSIFGLGCLILMVGKLVTCACERPGATAQTKPTIATHATALRSFFIDGDFQRLQKLGVLRSEAHLRLDRALRPFERSFILALVESYGCFEHQEYVVARRLDVGDRLRDAFGFGKGLVDGATELFH